MPRRFLLSLLAAVLVWMAAPFASAATTTTDLVVEPVGADPSETDRGWFRLAAAPGTSVDRGLRVTNGGPAPVVVELAAVGTATAERGGVAYGTEPDGPDAPAGTAAWVAVASPTLRLAPGQTTTVPVTVAVPGDAGPGDHLAGLSVRVAGDDGAGDGGDPAFGAHVSVRVRRVVAVEVRVPGPSTASLAVDGVAPVARPDGPYLTIALRNDGSELTKARGVLTVPGTGFRHEFTVDTFVPGTAIAFPVKWPGDDLPDGFEAHVELTVDGGTLQVWSGPVTTPASVRRELGDRVVAPPGTPARAPATVPRGALAAAALAIPGLLLVAAAARRRRRPAVA